MCGVRKNWGYLREGQGGREGRIHSRVDRSQRYLFVHLLKNAYDLYIYFDTTFNQMHAVLART